MKPERTETKNKGIMKNAFIPIAIYVCNKKCCGFI